MILSGWMGGSVTAMYAAIYGRGAGGHPRVLAFLCGAAGADVEVADTADGWTGLLIACYKGHADCVRVLLALGADPNRAATDGEGEVPVMRAAVHGQRACLEALREGGPGGAFTSLNAVGTGGDFEGMTALDLVEEMGYGDVEAMAVFLGGMGAKSADDL